MITKEQAIEIACPHYSKDNHDAVTVFPDEPSLLFLPRIGAIYNYDRMRVKWKDRDAWFVVYSYMPGSLSSSNCKVVDKMTGRVIGKFSLNDEG